MKLFQNMALACLVLLAACSGAGGDATLKTRYELPETPGGRLCLVQCRSAQAHCSDACRLDERACVTEGQSQAIKDYEAYVRDQFRTRAEVDLRPSDFERTENCEDKSCHRSCQKKYDSCFVGCGGKIEKESSCQFFCFD
ncbi:MAG: hypothetical protein PHW63_06825 [Alphaproteobacteria bacterium]|nr:hypothetical protein [Alphaproteobacteria bacterium]